MPEPLDKMANLCFKYNFALVSRIANSFAERSSFDLKDGATIDIEKARKEHEVLVQTLQRIGLDVIELPCDEKHPDGLFVDDIAVVINGTGLICNPPNMHNCPSRQGELAMVRQVIRKELGLKIAEVEEGEKAFVEGGDVLWTGRDIIVGLSKRTNYAGALQVAKTFPEYGTHVVHVPDEVVHLKDCITMAGVDVMVVSKTPHAMSIFNQIKALGIKGYKNLSVDEDEGANVLYCNGMLVHLSSEQIPKGFAVFENKIDYPRVAISLEEPLKRGGNLGSCVLLINRVRHPKKLPITIP